MAHNFFSPLLFSYQQTQYFLSPLYFHSLLSIPLYFSFSCTKSKYNIFTLTFLENLKESPIKYPLISKFGSLIYIYRQFSILHFFSEPHEFISQRCSCVLHLRVLSPAKLLRSVVHKFSILHFFSEPLRSFCWLRPNL